jgi:thiol-disulfide isomerase/thioredoxin
MFMFTYGICIKELARIARNAGKGARMPMNRRAMLLGVVVVIMRAATAYAADRLPYDAEVFQAALEAGKPILVHVTAPWCGECKLQKPIVARLAERSEFKDLTIFDVDFDTQKEALRRLKVQKQSTLLVFKGKAEITRSVGVTRAEAIEALMKKAL